MNQTVTARKVTMDEAEERALLKYANEIRDALIQMRAFDAAACVRDLLRCIRKQREEIEARKT